jgi:hypothetical protein
MAGGLSPAPAAAPEYPGGPFLKLRFPLRDLIGMNVELLRKLSQCSIARDRSKAPPSP